MTPYSWRPSLTFFVFQVVTGFGWNNVEHVNYKKLPRKFPKCWNCPNLFPQNSTCFHFWPHTSINSLTTTLFHGESWIMKQHSKRCIWASQTLTKYVIDERTRQYEKLWEWEKWHIFMWILCSYISVLAMAMLYSHLFLGPHVSFCRMSTTL